jgi:hypothetical protein
MGWNSWDSYGLTINEADFKANASVLASYRRFGWQYAVIDEGWYLQNPFAEEKEPRQYIIDSNGLLIPATSRFPSAAQGHGFEPLARWTHAQGLKFGIHIVRGIPKIAVKQNSLIGSSAFRAVDAADTADTCPWDEGNYGVRDTPAGQAYYDAMFALYAAWGLDFVKVDCIADHPYKLSEIRQISQAIHKAGRPMVLSLSPGPASLDHAEELARHSQMWRISNDIWDGWSFEHSKPGDDFPNGIITAFDNLAKWSSHAKPGNWPDADMLPFDHLEPHPGWGPPRQSKLTDDEVRTQFVLWSIARSPLILGSNLTKLSALTKSLMSNKDILAVNQHAHEAHPLPMESKEMRAWGASCAGQRIVALFNLDDKAARLEAGWALLGIPTGSRHAARDLLTGEPIEAAERLVISLHPHGIAIYVVDPVPGTDLCAAPSKQS